MAVEPLRLSQPPVQESSNGWTASSAFDREAAEARLRHSTVAVSDLQQGQVPVRFASRRERSPRLPDHYIFPEDMRYLHFDTEARRPRERYCGRVWDLEVPDAPDSTNPVQVALVDLSEAPGELLVKSYRKLAKQTGAYSPLIYMENGFVLLADNDELPNPLGPDADPTTTRPDLDIVSVITGADVVTEDGIVIAPSKKTDRKTGRPSMETYSLRRFTRQDAIDTTRPKATEEVATTLGPFIRNGDPQWLQGAAVHSFTEAVDDIFGWRAAGRAVEALDTIRQHTREKDTQAHRAHALHQLKQVVLMAAEQQNAETRHTYVLDKKEVNPVRFRVMSWGDSERKMLNLLDRVIGKTYEDRANHVVQQLGGIGPNASAVVTASSGNRLRVFDDLDGQSYVGTISDEQPVEIEKGHVLHAESIEGATSEEMYQSFFDSKVPLALGGIGCRMFLDSPDLDEQGFALYDLWSGSGKALDRLFWRNYFNDGSIPINGFSRLVRGRAHKPKYAVVSFPQEGEPEVDYVLQENDELNLCLAPDRKGIVPPPEAGPAPARAGRLRRSRSQDGSTPSAGKPIAHLAVLGGRLQVQQLSTENGVLMAAKQEAV